MSKKTNEAKRKAAMKKPRRNAHKRRGRRPNPAYLGLPADWTGDPSKPASIFSDPILFHHLASFILRSLELYQPNPLVGFGEFSPAVFIKPEGLAGTDNSELPDDKEGE